MKVSGAIFVKEVTVTDPDTKNDVNVSIYKHEESGGMFGIDTSYIKDNFDDDETPMIPDPFNADCFVELIEE